MGFWGRVNDAFHALRGEPRVVEVAKIESRDAVDPQPWNLRRWESADTTRLNSAQWAVANGHPIDVDLATRLRNLRIRSQYEAANNPYVAGVINTYAHDLVGPNGPTLSVESNNKAYNEALEEIWGGWFAMPDLLGELSGADMLRLNAGQEWTHGEWIEQLVTEGRGAVALRMLAVDPARLDTPPQQAGDPLTVLGVKKTKQGKPLWYYLEKQEKFGPHQIGGFEYQAVSPEDLIHGFDRIEPGQTRGVPRLATQLQTCADLRLFDQQTLDCMIAAADSGVFFQMRNVPDGYSGEVLAVEETTEIERRTQSFLPPGYEAMQMRPEHPAENALEYRRARLAELGRPVCMPLMIVLLSSEESNFASARFDAQNYQRFLRCRQAWYERVKLNRLVNEIAKEAERGGHLPRRPDKVKLCWTWWKLPHVDPKKEADAEKIRISESCTQTVGDALEDRGRDLETHLVTLKREVEAFELAGLEHPAKRKPQPAMAADAAGSDDDKNDDEDSESGSRPRNRRQRREVASA